MARVAKKDIKGFGTVSTPAARAVDDFASQGNASAIPPNGAMQLAEALGKATDRMASQGRVDAKEAERLKNEQDKRRIKALAATVKSEKEAGIINLTQSGQLAPDMSKANQIHLTEAIAANRAREDLDNWITEVNNQGGSLFNNKKALQDKIDAKRDELLDKYTQRDANGQVMIDPETGLPMTFEFALSGALTSFDSTINQYKSGWEAQRAKFHKDESKKYHKGETSSIIRNAIVDKSLNTNAGLKAMTAKIDGIDYMGKTMSPLNAKERKTEIFNAYIQTAVDEGNLDVLTAIPIKYRDGNSETAIAAARKKINDDAVSRFNANARKKNYLRTEGKIEAENIIAEMYQGTFKPKEGEENFGVADYSKASRTEINKAVRKLIMRDDYSEIRSDLIQFANTEKDIEDNLIDKLESAKQQENFRSDFLIAATQSEDALANFLFDSQANRSNFLEAKGSARTIMIHDAIKAKSGVMNRADRLTVIKEIPKLLAGVDVVRSPTVNTFYNARVGEAIKTYTSSLGGKLESRIQGAAFAQASRKIFDETMSRQVLLVIQKTGQVPQTSLDPDDKNSLDYLMEQAMKITLENVKAVTVAGGEGGLNATSLNAAVKSTVEENVPAPIVIE